jgi:hypothetical protein
MEVFKSLLKFTANASNFGRDGSFGSFFPEGLAIIKTSPTEK